MRAALMTEGTNSRDQRPTHWSYAALSTVRPVEAWYPGPKLVIMSRLSWCSVSWTQLVRNLATSLDWPSLSSAPLACQLLSRTYTYGAQLSHVSCTPGCYGEFVARRTRPCHSPGHY